MGCVALEITQRCNLDCTLCYLSPHAESIKDIPLSELFRRIEMILAHYGPGTNIQVTGGDPTLRKREELVAIVRRIHDSGMRPCLFTNGIRATRELLRELASNGMRDVVYHVDMTQQRRGYGSEVELNTLRKEYVDRARGLPIRVIFNTTVFGGNIEEIPHLVRFFSRHAGRIAMASFQLQADTGRGVLGLRSPDITPEAVAEHISAGAETTVNFDAAQAGHSRCNRYAVCLVAGGKAFNLFEATPFVQKLFERTRNCSLDSRYPFQSALSVVAALLATPSLWAGLAGYVGRKLWEMAGALIKSGGRVHKLSFFIHNFMDAAGLDAERCRTCVFMVATQEGPLSMCVHNAKRDDYLLRPLPLDRGYGREWWQPLMGKVIRPVLPPAISSKQPSKPPPGPTTQLPESPALHPSAHPAARDRPEDQPMNPPAASIKNH
jgi:hypothetical protein